MTSVCHISFTQTDDASVFFEYRKRGYKIDLFCGVWYDEGENPIIIDNKLVKQLEEINVKIEMDEYWI